MLNKWFFAPIRAIFIRCGEARKPRALTELFHSVWETLHKCRKLCITRVRRVNTPKTGWESDHAKRTARAEAPSGRDRQRCTHCQDRDRRGTRDIVEATSQAQERFGGSEGACGEVDARGPQGDCREGRCGTVGLMISAFDVAGTLGERSDWHLSNLSLQKLVYLAQMIHLGEANEPLFPEQFEAWDYGPVIPSLYHELKMFGSDHVEAYASLGRMEATSDLHSEILDYLVDLGKKKKPGQLVALTHWKGGAWAKNYEKHIKGLTIPNRDIKQEYLDRIAD